MPTYTEENFEDHIEAHLNQSGYRSQQSAIYNRSLCLIPDEMLQVYSGHATDSVSETGTPVWGGDTS